MTLNAEADNCDDPVNGQSAAADIPTRPKGMRVIADAIPEFLKAQDQWLVWGYVEEVDKDTGEIDYDKPPVNARTGSAGSSTNRKTWSPFDVALQAYHRDCYDPVTGQGRYDGIGFALSLKMGPEDSKGVDAPLHLIGVDLDHCRDAITGTIEPWAMAIIDALNTYSEVSPSGTGVPLFLLGTLPRHGRKKGHYENYETGRYVTVTGQHIPGTPLTIEARQDALRRIHNDQFGEERKAESNGNSRSGSTPHDLADADLLERMFRSKNGGRIRTLWHGDASGYKSGSEADLALVNHLGWWCNYDRQRVCDLFAQSGLYRSKWNRPDYRERTLSKALDGQSGGYEPRGGRHKSPFGANGAPPSKNGTKPQTDACVTPREFHLTDLGNSRRVVARHGADWRYCHPFKKSYIYDGTRWAEDDTAAAIRLVKETQTSLYGEVAHQIVELGKLADEDERKKELPQLTRKLKHLLSWEDARRISACLQLATSEPGIPILPADMDRDPFMLNVRNGTIDLRTGELREHRRRDLITKLAPVEYDPNAQCVLWLRFLQRIMDGNQALITYLQRTAGYSLTGDVREQCLFFLHGGGANGKSTYLGVPKHILGGYGYQAVPELLMAKNTEAHPTERADLFGKRFVCTIETDEGKRLAEALMKQLTGGDSVTARKMRQDFFEFEMTGKIFLAANHKPQVRGADYAVWRRIKLIPFTVTIPDHEKDKTLLAKLKAESSGILAWAIQGCLDWQRDGLAEPEEVSGATAAYRAEQDVIHAFIDDCCFVNDAVKVRTSLLYEAYQRWSGDKLMTAAAFRNYMNGKGFKSERGTGGNWFYHGIGLQASMASDGR